MVFLGPILSISAIVTTVLLVLLTEAPVAAKVTAALVCAGVFLLPHLVHAVGVLVGPAKAVLSIVIIIYLKYTRAIS